MKTLILKGTTFFIMLLLVASIPACKKKTDEGTSFSPRELLSGTTSKAWLLNRATVNNMEQCLGTCAKANDKIIFNNSGSYSISTYTCDERNCGLGTLVQNGTTGSWNISGDGKILVVDGVSVSLVTLSATELVIDYAGSKSYYVKTDDQTILSRTQQLAGTLGKAWKYARRVVDGVDQTLTQPLLATRFTNLPNGGLITSYTDSSNPTINGNWYFNTDESVYTSVKPASGSIPASVNNFAILELTDKTMIIRYTDGGGHVVELYQVPDVH